LTALELVTHPTIWVFVECIKMQAIFVEVMLVMVITPVTGVGLVGPGLMMV
jgi:hypothetical protein